MIALWDAWESYLLLLNSLKKSAATKKSNIIWMDSNF